MESSCPTGTRRTTLRRVLHQAMETTQTAETGAMVATPLIAQTLATSRRTPISTWLSMGWPTLPKEPSLSLAARTRWVSIRAAQAWLLLAKFVSILPTETTIKDIQVNASIFRLPLSRRLTFRYLPQAHVATHHPCTSLCRRLQPDGTSGASK